MDPQIIDTLIINNIENHEYSFLDVYEHDLKCDCGEYPCNALIDSEKGEKVKDSIRVNN